VYGQVVCTGTQDGASQHNGFGTQLLRTAEHFAQIHQKDQIAVIAGVGTRNYYASRQYTLLDMDNGEMMVKSLIVSKTVVNRVLNRVSRYLTLETIIIVMKLILMISFGIFVYSTDIQILDI